MTSLETYLRQLRQERPAAVKETSFYGALANLFNAVGESLRPKVKYVITPQGQGAGIPDGGLYTATQLRRGAEVSPAAVLPERGCVEVKGLKEEVEEVAAGAQVGKYLERYGLVLVTNYRDFLLVGVDEAGRRKNLERYRLAASEAEFWQRAERARETAAEHGGRFEEYLRRVMLHAAPLSRPEDVARFLASYARDAKVLVERGAGLPALRSLRAALEEALGMKFEGERGEHFFRSTLVQTLFYGVFSAWVLWSQKQAREGGREKFRWREASWTLRVPMINALFEQLLMRSRLEPLGLVEVLNWTEAVLNRVESPAAFVERFTEGHAVQYFYEPFLQEFDPELRKQLGVWYTPQEIVRYMVERVDAVLREELGVAEGLADEQVYVLDPCCGTGAYLVEVLRRIELTMRERGEGATAGAQLKAAAMKRVFGFEILPAPFVVAHLQLGLLLQTIGVPLAESGAERVAVFLTNALTGWEPPKEPKTRLLFPELEEERDLAEKVKRETPILVVIGNPPYNAFAGTSPAEEQGLVEPYKEGLISEWGIRKFNLDDLYVRFFRLAERRIAEQTGRGIISFITNYSWTSEPSFVVMRQHLLESFDKFWIENMHGNRKITEYAPDGRTSETVFAIQGFSVGIRQGVAISLLVKTGDEEKVIRYRNDLDDAKAAERRAHLLDSLQADDFNAQYEIAYPKRSNRYLLRPSDVASHYLSWPLLTELSEVSPLQGLDEDRAFDLIDIGREKLAERISAFLNESIEFDSLKKLTPGLTRNSARYEAKKARARFIDTEEFLSERIVRYNLRPLDVRWCYYTSVRPIWKEPRPDLWRQVGADNAFLISRPAGLANPEGVPFLFTKNLLARDAMRGHAIAFPMYLHAPRKQPSNKQQQAFFDVTKTTQKARPNLSSRAREYLSAIGVGDPDADEENAGLVWMHALAIGYSPAYLSENADGIRGDWPRVPLPGDLAGLRRSAELGRSVAVLLAYDPADASTNSPLLKGIITSPLRAELRVVGTPARVGGGQLRPGEGEFALEANWGFSTPRGVMPGRGRVEERDYTDEERGGVASGAAALGLSEAEALRRLGERTFDVYLNGVAFWRNVPARVWNYHVGGYQVLKKWLSYREREVLGRDLSAAEVNEVRDMARRIAALLLLEPALDANYDSIKQNAYAFPASA